MKSVLSKIRKIVLPGLVLALCTGLAFSPLCAQEKPDDKKIYRVGYIEGGPFWTFSQTMDAIKAQLDQSGFKDRVTYPKDAYYSPGWANKDLLQTQAKEIMGRDDLDLVIAAGTAANAAVLEHNTQKIPVMGISVADAVKANFVKSEKDSGVDNYIVRIVPGRYERMFRIFSDVVGFQKLGLLYSDTENGRKYANVEDARKVAKERGFTIIEYNKVSESATANDCAEGIKWLIDQGIDAFFIPVLYCFDWTTSDVERLLNLLNKNKIPTFAREGTKYVKAGALMGFSTIDFSKRGNFLADKIMRIFNGEKPRSLPMVDEATPKISMNLKVAEIIGFDPSFDILAVSDELFQEITLPEDRLVK